MAEGNNESLEIVFLIPVFNEEDNLNELFKNLQPYIPNSAFVFVDDCSTDRSREIINALFQDCRFELILKEANQGPGDSFNRGFEYILQHYDDDSLRVITMEADNTSDIHLLPAMMAISKLSYDLVLASIYAQGGGFSQTSLFRKVLSFTANMIFRAVYDVKVLTLSSFYRIYTLSILRKIQANSKQIISEKGFVSMLEILLKAIYCEASIIEVPMVLKSDKRVGKSKMKIFNSSISYLKFLVSFKLSNSKN